VCTTIPPNKIKIQLGDFNEKIGRKIIHKSIIGKKINNRRISVMSGNQKLIKTLYQTNNKGKSRV